MRQVLERAHASFCEAVGRLGDNAVPMVVVLYPEVVVPMLVPGGADEILAALSALAHPSSPLTAREVEGIMVHACAWAIDADAYADGPPRALGEAGDPRARSLAMSWLCRIGADGEPSLEGRATSYDPVTLELGATDETEPEAGGFLGAALAIATVICHGV